MHSLSLIWKWNFTFSSLLSSLTVVHQWSCPRSKWNCFLMPVISVILCIELPVRTNSRTKRISEFKEHPARRCWRDRNIVWLLIPIPDLGTDQFGCMRHYSSWGPFHCSQFTHQPLLSYTHTQLRSFVSLVPGGADVAVMDLRGSSWR